MRPTLFQGGQPARIALLVLAGLVSLIAGGCHESADPAMDGGQTVADVGGQTVPDVGGRKIPDVGGRKIPDVGGRKIPDVGGQTIPDVKVPLDRSPDKHKPDACVPKTCISLGATCGKAPDGCGGTLSCGACVPLPNGKNVCLKGQCSASCSSGFHMCNAACVSNMSLNHCGTSCKPCPSVTGGTATCDGVKCGVSCNKGSRPCATGCCPWVKEVIATSPSTLHSASMAMDASGALHIVYWDYGKKTVWHARKKGGTWSSASVMPLDIAVHTSELAANGNTLHLVISGRYLKYAGGAWSKPQWFTGTVNSDGYGASIALDSAGSPHVGYATSGNGFKYARLVGGAWKVELVEAGASYNDRVSLRLLPSGAPIMAYRGNKAYRVATRSGGKWTYQTVESTGMYYANVTMQVSPTGVVRVSIPQSGATMKLAEVSGGKWTTAQAGKGWGRLPRGYSASPMIPFIYDTSPYTTFPISLARRSGTTWTKEEIDAYGGNGASINDALMDKSGDLWVLVGGWQSLRLYH